jgi:hypothetical protein
MSDTSSLARELGAIASGEAWRNTREWDDKEQTDRFATGLERLIDERIAAAVAPLAEKIAMLVTCETDGSAALAREDVRLCCMGNGCGVVPHRRQPSPEAGPAWRCSECGEPRSESAKSAAVAIGDAFDHDSEVAVYEVTAIDGEYSGVLLKSPDGRGSYHGDRVPPSELLDPDGRWRRVRAVDIPKAAEPVEVGDRFEIVGDPDRATITVAATDGDKVTVRFPACTWHGMPRALLFDGARFTRLPRVTAEPPPGVVVVGDTFLRLTKTESRFSPGMVGIVTQVHTGFEPIVHVEGVDFRSVREASHFLTSGDWQRVPAGYVLPTAIEWHAATVRLIEARRLMKADPRTGTDGIDACIDAMARMARMEVPA